MEGSINPNRKYQIALVAVVIAIVVVGWVYFNGRSAGVQLPVLPVDNDSLEEELIEDSVEAVDSIIVDSMPSVDTLDVDSSTQSVPTEYAKIYDSSKRELKNELMTLEQLIRDVDREYYDGNISADSVQVIGDSVLSVLANEIDHKNADNFKNQINSIKRKTNNLLKRIKGTKN